MDTIEPTPQTSREENCSVCGDHADGYHYGVLSCRGCNAFFRRAITYNLDFQCRRGGNCIIDRNARCACRACRLEKCKMVGMDRLAVQVSHDKNGWKTGGQAASDNKMRTPPGSVANGDVGAPLFERRTDHDTRVNGIGIARTMAPPATFSGGASLASPSDSAASQQSSPAALANGVSGTSLTGGECVRSPGSAFTLVGGGRTSLSPNLRLNGQQITSPPHPVFIFGSAPTISMIPSTCLSPPAVDRPDNATAFFTRLTDEYFDQRRRRRSMLCVTLEDVLSETAETNILGAPATLEDLNVIYRVQMILMFEWVEKLPEFQQLSSAHDKVCLLRAFSLKYLVLDNVVYSLEHGQLDRLVLVNNSYIQPGFLPASLNNCTSLEQHRAFLLMYGENATKTVKELLKPMAEMNISFAEFMFLRLLLLWNPGNIGLTPQADNLVQKASENALQQLHAHFEFDQTIDLKSRLGTLLLFLSPLTKHTQNLAEITALIPNFGVLPEWDSFMNDLLRT